MPPSPPSSAPANIVYYDEHCRLCQASIRFIARRDRHGRFTFTPLQQPAGQDAARMAGLDPDAPGSLILEDQDGLHLRSTGALRIVARLPFPWPLLTVLRVLPRPLRDGLYNGMARRRYRWFGTT